MEFTFLKLLAVFIKLFSTFATEDDVNSGACEQPLDIFRERMYLKANQRTMNVFYIIVYKKEGTTYTIVAFVLSGQLVLQDMALHVPTFVKLC